MCRRIRVPENIKDRKGPDVKAVHGVTMEADIDRGCTEPEEPRGGKTEIVNLDCWNGETENWRDWKEIARTWGFGEKKIG